MFKFKMARIKKIIAVSIAAFIASLVVVSTSNAQLLGGLGGGSEKLLALIVQYTHKTAENTYYIEQFTYKMLMVLNSWMLPDKSDTTANLQSSFVTVTNTALQNATTQTGLQKQLTQDLFSQGNTTDLDYLNDLSFETLLSQPYQSPDPRTKKGQKVDSAYNYIKNAAGLTISYPAPDKGWTGYETDKTNYENFYKTISSIQTYNAYVLSQLYAEAAGGNAFTKQQNALMQQASNSDWFAQVASESIGTVLRQILMYNSQTYVLLTQLLQTQKQVLAAQAMTNTLMIAGSAFTTEIILLNKAKEVGH